LVEGQKDPEAELCPESGRGHNLGNPDAADAYDNLATTYLANGQKGLW
jgi:hypothetical protein